MLRTAVLAVVATALFACDSQRLTCYGPDDCSGNACCLFIPSGANGSTTLQCTPTPQSCEPKFTVEGHYNRLCETDADCSAGGIDTSQNRCCPSAVMSHAAGTCAANCLPR